MLLNAKGEPRAGGGGAAASRPATAPPAKAGSEAAKPVARPATAKPAAGVRFRLYIKLFCWTGKLLIQLKFFSKI